MSIVNNISSTCGGLQICCMHIDASIQELLKLADFFGWTASGSTSSSTTTTTIQSLPTTRKFWITDFLFAGRSMFIPNKGAYYLGNTVANITATNPDLIAMGSFSQNFAGSQGMSISRSIAPNISSPFVTISPDYTINDGSGLPILRSIRDSYTYLVKVINNSFLATRNPQIFIKRVSFPVGTDPFSNDAGFIVGVDFDSTGQERESRTLSVKNYDFVGIPGTINVANFTYSVQFGGFTGNYSNISMSLYPPASSWVNNVTLISNATIREDFPIPPGW